MIVLLCKYIDKHKTTTRGKTSDYSASQEILNDGIPIIQQTTTNNTGYFGGSRQDGRW